MNYTRLLRAMASSAQNLWGKEHLVKLVVHFDATGACSLAYVMEVDGVRAPCLRVGGREPVMVGAQRFIDAVLKMEKLLHEETISALNARWRDKACQPRPKKS